MALKGKPIERIAAALIGTSLAVTGLHAAAADKIYQYKVASVTTFSDIAPQ